MTDYLESDNPLTGVRASEHAIPQWLMKHLEMKEDQLYLAAAQSADDAVVETRQHTARSFVAGRVCEERNNGYQGFGLTFWFTSRHKRE